MNILIVEDEIMARKNLANTLTRLYPDMKISGETGSVAETIAWLKNPENKADIIFMDVELSDGNCFEIFRQTDIRAQVIMTTAYDNYAVKAFEVESLDYLLKPVDETALKRAVGRCLARTGKDAGLPQSDRSADKDPQGRKHPKERFLVKLNDTIVPVKTIEIAYFYSEDKATYIVTKSGKKYIVDFSLDIATCRLPDDVFFRISRNCIISLPAISSIIRIGSRFKIESAPASSFEMIVSRSRTDDFLRWLEGR